MASKKQEGDKPRKPRKKPAARKATTRRNVRSEEEVIEPEDIEAVEEEVLDDADDEAIEVEIEIEIEDDDAADDEREARRRRKRREFKRQFKREFNREFNAEDIFGPNGPFGAGGPFGARGLFGPGGIFGNGGGGRGRGRHGRGGGGFGQRPRRERMFGPGELRLVLLAMLAEEPRHGYELIKALEDMTGGSYTPSPGTIYPTLQMLSDEGMIAEKESEDSRKLFQATDAGIDELEERSDEIEDLWERLGRKAEKAKPAGSSDVFRSLGNLATVLTNKAARGDLKGVEKEQVIDLIDALARKIERL